MNTMSDLANWERIPLSSVPAQTLRVMLGTQPFRIELQQRESGLYLSLYRASSKILLNRLCRDRTWIVRRAYHGMPGDLVFLDTIGREDPEYTGLVSRFLLLFRAGAQDE